MNTPTNCSTEVLIDNNDYWASCFLYHVHLVCSATAATHFADMLTSLGRPNLNDIEFIIGCNLAQLAALGDLKAFISLSASLLRAHFDQAAKPPDPDDPPPTLPSRCSTLGGKHVQDAPEEMKVLCVCPELVKLDTGGRGNGGSNSDLSAVCVVTGMLLHVAADDASYVLCEQFLYAELPSCILESVITAPAPSSILAVAEAAEELTRVILSHSTLGLAIVVFQDVAEHTQPRYFSANLSHAYSVDGAAVWLCPATNASLAVQRVSKGIFTQNLVQLRQPWPPPMLLECLGEGVWIVQALGLSFSSGSLFSVECNCSNICGQNVLQLLLAVGNFQSNCYLSGECVLHKLSPGFSGVHSFDAATNESLIVEYSISPMDQMGCIYLIIDGRPVLLLGVDKWGLILLPAHIYQGVFQVAVTFAEIAVTLWTFPAVIELSNLLSSRLLWKPPWQLSASAAIIFAGLDVVVGRKDQEHAATDVVPAESTMPNDAAPPALSKVIGQQLFKMGLQIQVIIQFPWDLGGSELFHRLGGRPKLKKGGMSDTCISWATSRMGLGPLILQPAPRAAPWPIATSPSSNRQQLYKRRQGRGHSGINHYQKDYLYPLLYLY